MFHDSVVTVCCIFNALCKGSKVKFTCVYFTNLAKNRSAKFMTIYGLNLGHGLTVHIGCLG